MKVRTAFEFSDAQLRTIRAAHGRGGKATRKESVGFVLRAVEAALKAAPEAKPARRPKPVVVTAPAPEPVGTDEDRAKAVRDRDPPPLSTA